jgi:hypothetical protein
VFDVEEINCHSRTMPCRLSCVWYIKHRSAQKIPRVASKVWSDPSADFEVYLRETCFDTNSRSEIYSARFRDGNS